MIAPSDLQPPSGSLVKDLRVAAIILHQMSRLGESLSRLGQGAVKAGQDVWLMSRRLVTADH